MRWRAWWPAVFLLPAGFLLVISQAGIVFRDEGYHLLAVDLVLAGRRPYADFFFHHPPLYILLQAGWSLLVNGTWRMAHLFSALFSIAAALLAARFTWVVIGESRWRRPGAFLAAVFVSTNLLVARYGTMGHYAGVAMCLAFAGFFFLTVRDDKGIPRPFLAGVCSGASMMATFLTALMVPLLGLRILLHSNAERPGRALFMFTVGVLFSSIPLLFLFYLAPEQTYFEVFRYHLLRRAGSWTDPQVLQWDRQILFSWLYSLSGFILGFLAIAGSIFVLWRRGQEGKRKAFAFAIFSGVAIAIPAIATHPTFDYYYTLLIPFFAVVAAIGLCEIGAYVSRRTNPWIPVLFLATIYSYGAARIAFQHYKSPGSPWEKLETIGQAVADVTPEGELLFAPELIYHTAQSLPPSGLENTYASESVPEQFIGTLVSTLSLRQIDQQLQSDVFYIVVLWNRDERVERLNIPARYREHRRFEDFTIWTKTANAAQKSRSRGKINKTR